MKAMQRASPGLGSVPAIVAALKACICARDLQGGMKIHGSLPQAGNIFVANTLVDMYAKCGRLVDAQRIFDRMPQHSVVSWSAIIMGYAQAGYGELALQLFARMQDWGCIPDAKLYVAALKACSSMVATDQAACLRKGSAIHFQIAGSGHESNIFVANTLVDMYAKCGSMADSQRVFDKMLERDVVTWNAIITGYAQSGDCDTALQLFFRMQAEGYEQDPLVFVAALKACSNAAEIVDHDKRAAILEKGRGIHLQLAKKGYESEILVANTLIDMYAKCGSMDEARRVFDRMPHRSIVSWNGMITGYAQGGQAETSLQLFRRMQEQGLVPDARIFMAALQACGGLSDLDAGRRIHSQIRKAALEKDVLVANCLISFYGRCGSMGEAKQVFDLMRSRDTVTWTALITGYSHQGDSEQVFDLLERMQKQGGVQPNSVTFLSVLTVCSHAGLVERGRHYFEVMHRVFSIRPSVEHYICIVDILSRKNQLDEAMEAVKSMPYEPNLLAWRTILAAAKKWGNVPIGRIAFEEILKLNAGQDEVNDAAFVLMAQIYAGAGMWDESARIESLRQAAVHLKSSKQSRI